MSNLSTSEVSTLSAIVGKMSDSDLARFESEIALLPSHDFVNGALRIAREEIQKRDDADCARAEASEGYGLTIGAAKPFGLPAGQPICDNGGLLRWPIPALAISHPALG